MPLVSGSTPLEFEIPPGSPWVAISFPKDCKKTFIWVCVNAASGVCVVRFNRSAAAIETTAPSVSGSSKTTFGIA